MHEFLWWPLLPSMIFHHYLLRLSRLHSMIALSDSMPIIFMRIYANVQSLTCIFAFYDPYMSVFFDLYCCLLWPVYSMKLPYTTFYNLHRCLSMTPAWHCDFYGSIRFKSSNFYDTLPNPCMYFYATWAKLLWSEIINKSLDCIPTLLRLSFYDMKSWTNWTVFLRYLG